MLVPLRKKSTTPTSSTSPYRVSGSAQLGEIVVERADQVMPNVPEAGAFDENLAAKLTRGQRMTLASKLIEYATVDKDSRKDWETRETKGLEMAGMKEMPKESPNAPGVNHAVHPLMAEAVVQFQARAVSELFPATGPAKCIVVGENTKELVEQADRVETYMNYYLTQEDRGYFADSDQMLNYLPMSGSVFRKCGQNWATGKPELRYVKAVDFIASYCGQDLQNMPRYAHSFSMDASDIKRGQVSGMLLSEAQLTPPAPGSAQNSSTSDASDERLPSYHDDDVVYPFYEYHIILDLKQDTWGFSTLGEGVEDVETIRYLPYIVLVEETSQEILCIRRNWDEQDTQYRKNILFAHYKFLPGMGFYGEGLPHLIGSLQLSSSAAINALLDAAFAANFQGGFKAKGSRLSGEAVLKHGEWKDTDLSQEDLAKSFYTPPFKEPSPALAKLLEILVETGRRFAGTTDVNVGDQSSQNAPVGTTLALIEQANKPQSAIHKRLHDSLKQELQMLFKHIRDYVPQEYPYNVADQSATVMQADFSDAIDIVPVSDPNIYSSTQRIAMAQAVLQLQQQAPDLYGRKQRVAAHVMMLKALRVPDIDDIEPDDPTAPVNTDPITENGEMFQGHGAKAFEPQDHAAHLAVHKNGLQFAQGTMDDQTFQQVYPVFQAHIREHLAMQYTQMAFAQANIPAPPTDDDGAPAELPPDIERTISRLVVRALPAPPMSQQQQQDAQQGQQIMSASDAKIKAREQETQAEIQRKDALAAAEAKRKDNVTAADIQRDTTSFVTDQARQHKAAVLDEQRKNTSVSSDIIRKSAADQVKLHATAKQADVKLKTDKEKATIAKDLASHKAKQAKKAKKTKP